MTIVEPSTSPTLLVAAQTGQPDAWQRLVHVYAPLIYAWARRSGLQAADAADVTQDTLASVSQSLLQYDPAIGSGRFRGWLWTILKRRLADAMRRDQHLVDLGSAVVGIAAAEPPGDAASDASGILQRAVLSYRPRYDNKTWRAFWATVVEGRDCGAVAEELQLSKWAIYKARARILQRLREDLDGLY